jgi:hypothetical protein
VDSLAALAPLFFLCHLRGLFLFGASGSGALLMDAFFSATLSRPPLEGPLAWVVPALGELVCHGGNMRSIFPTSPHPCMATRCTWNKETRPVKPGFLHVSTAHAGCAGQ